MKTIEEILPCSCGELYKSRNLTSPDCVYCNYAEDIKDLINQHLTAQAELIAENATTESIYPHVLIKVSKNSIKQASEEYKQSIQ